MPYIRYKAQAYNVTTQTMIDMFPIIYSFYRYTGPQFTVTGPTALSDVDWNTYGDGQVGTNIGTRIEYYAKQHYYNSGLTEWPVIRILTTNDVDDYYIEFDHNSPHFLAVKAGGAKQSNMIPFLWSDDLDIVGGVPRFNTLYPRVFTCVDSAEDLLHTVNFFGTFAPVDDSVVNWATYVTNDQYVISSDLDIVRYNSNNLLATFHTNSEGITVSKTNDGIGLYYIYDRGPSYTGRYAIAGITLCDNNGNFLPGYDCLYISNRLAAPGKGPAFTWNGLRWVVYYSNPNSSSSYVYNAIGVDTTLPLLNAPMYNPSTQPRYQAVIDGFLEPYVDVDTEGNLIYVYLTGVITPIEPPSDVDPEDIPPQDEPPTPIPPDGPDPYYDPGSDPTSPSYDPQKDPESPSYDPTQPATPWQPVVTPTQIEPPPIIDPPSPVPVPVTPPTYANNSRLFTIYTPTVSQLTDFANFLWASPLDIPATFRKIVVSPMDCVLGLMVIPQLTVPHSSRELNIGNIGTGITMDYATSQFVDFDCGSVFLQEYYRSYLDYSPYTKLDIFLPFIGTRELSIDECMQKTVSVIYRFDLASGTCVAFIRVNGTVLYQFDGNCASHIPLSSSDWGSTVRSIPTNVVAAVKAGGALGLGSGGALGIAAAASVMSMKERVPHSGSLAGSAGLMGIPYPYLIVTRPCQALPRSQNSFSGYPSFITMSLGECSGYTEVHQCHLEHIPATGEELEEIERLLKEGVLF